MKVTKNMKRILSFLCLSIFLSVFLGGCKITEDSDEKYVLEKGVLTVGVSDVAPFCYIDEQGNRVGFDVQLAQGFAEELGVKVKFVTVDLNRQYEILKNKEVDCLWNSQIASDELDKDTDFTKPYCESALSIVCKTTKKYTFTSLEKLSGLKLAVIDGSEDVLGAVKNDLTVMKVDTAEQALSFVAQGKAQAAVIDLFYANSMVGKEKTFSTLSVGGKLEAKQYSVCFRENSDLTAKATEYLASCFDDGYTKQLEKKYNMDQSALKIEKEFSQVLAIVLHSLNIGFIQTLKLFAITLLGALPLGLIISFGSMSKFKLLKYVTKMIIWIVRGSPLLLQLLIIYYVPGGALWGSGESGRFVACCVAFILNYSCYFSEIFRSGIESIPHGQEEAGQVLGMTRSQIFFKVTLLQMIKRIVPPMSNEIITLVKDTSLARIIALQEIIWAGYSFMKGSQGISGLVWPLFCTGVYYLLFNGVLTIFFSRIEKKLDYFKA